MLKEEYTSDSLPEPYITSCDLEPHGIEGLYEFIKIYSWLKNAGLGDFYTQSDVGKRPKYKRGVCLTKGAIYAFVIDAEKCDMVEYLCEDCGCRMPPQAKRENKPLCRACKR